MRSLKDECLHRMIFIGETSLRRATRELIEYDHRERDHHGVGNRLLEPDVCRVDEGDIARTERLGGMLRYYHREAA